MLKKKAYKYRIYPTDEQKVFFAKTFGSVRFIYNVMLHDKISHYKESGELLRNTPAQYKKEHPFLKEVDSLALANAQLNLEKAYKNFFRELKKGNKDQGFPKFKKKMYAQSYTTNNQIIRKSEQESRASTSHGTVSIVENKYLNIPKLKTLVSIKLHRQIPPNAQIKSVTIERTSSGKFYASLLVIEDILPLEPLNTKVAIDLGLKSFATLSSGESIPNPKHLGQSEDKLIRLQRALSRKKKGSHNYYKNKRLLALQHEKISNQRNDFLHRLSRDLINKNQVINIESLKVKNMLKNPKLAKSIADASWSLFTDMLDYKSDWYGRTLNRADAYYASSQLCHVCGHKNSEVKDLSVRKWTCPECQTYHDRDGNASQNLLKIG